MPSVEPFILFYMAPEFAHNTPVKSEVLTTSILTGQQVRLIEKTFANFALEIDRLDSEIPEEKKRLNEIEKTIKELNSILRHSIKNTQKVYSRHLAV